jgi:hypothetical protein
MPFATFERPFADSRLPASCLDSTLTSMTRILALLLLPFLAPPPAQQETAPARSMSEMRHLDAADRDAVLALREAVWRNWFAGNTEPLRRVLPTELITLEPGGTWGTLTSTLADSRKFAASGGTLARLAFPRTEFQAYGATVILYSSYDMDLVHDGVTRNERGLATEVFVQQADGRWLHTGWQLAPVTPR